MARRQVAGLQRVLGVYPMASSAYGNVGSSIYYALGLVAALALGLTPIVFVISGFIFFLTASTYAEATAMFPEAGGSSSFARHAFNEFWSFFAAWGQMLNYTFTVAISAYFVPHYLGGLFWSALRHPPGDVFGGLVVIALLAAVNVRGVEESTGINVALAVLDFATQLLLVALGLVLVFSPHTIIHNVHFGVAPSWQNFFVAIPLCMLAYTGIETISNMSEEARDPGRTVPAAINRVVIAVFAIYALLPTIALSALPVTRQANGSYITKLGLGEPQGGYAGDPVLGVVRQLHLGFLQHPAELYVGLLAATILFIATNAGLIGVSRLVYAMGMHRQVPDRLRQLHPHFRTPWIAILLFSALAGVALIPGQADFLGNMYAFGAMLSFTIAHLSVVQMRRSLSDQERPYRGPGNVRLGNMDIPLFAVFGGAATFVSLCVVTVLHVTVAIAGLGWLAIGVVFYYFFRHHHGLELTRTVQIVEPSSPVEGEAEYESVLVAFPRTTFSEEAMALALRIGARRRRAIHVLVTIDVPAFLTADAILPDAEAAAQSVIEQAKVQGGRRVTGTVRRVRPRQHGPAIVDEAKRIKASAIVLSKSNKQSMGVFDQTEQHVLGARPCRVVIESEPPDVRRPSRALAPA